MDAHVAIIAEKDLVVIAAVTIATHRTRMVIRLPANQ
jgi:hypothetical protein